MTKGEIKVNACYDVIVEILKNDDEFYEKNGRWISNDEMFNKCKKKVKGLRKIEFYSALEQENEIYSSDVEKYMKRIKML